MSIDVTACIITYNSETYIEECLRSIVAAGLPSSQIAIIDNASQDRTVEIVRGGFPEVRLQVLEDNLGHSYACNEAILKASTKWVVLLDHDTIVHKNWLVGLMEAVSLEPEAGIVVSRAIFHHDMETIHSDGGYAHFLGAMVLRHGFIRQLDASKEMTEIGAAGTTSMLVNRMKAVEVGLFDSDFFIYSNDFEFSLRMRLFGYKIFSAPASVIYHKGGSPDVSFRGVGAYPARRAYFILRNRWFLLLKIYRLRTLLLCFPSLMLYEMVLFLMSVKNDLVSEYVSALKWICQHFKDILTKRRCVQEARCVGDGQILTALNMTFVPGLIKSRFARVVKKVFDFIFWAHWKLVHPFV